MRFVRVCNHVPLLDQSCGSLWVMVQKHPSVNRPFKILLYEWTRDESIQLIHAGQWVFAENKTPARPIVRPQQTRWRTKRFLLAFLRSDKQKIDPHLGRAVVLPNQKTHHSHLVPWAGIILRLQYRSNNGIRMWLHTSCYVIPYINIMSISAKHWTNVQTLNLFSISSQCRHH